MHGTPIPSFTSDLFTQLEHGDVPLSPVTVGELPPAVCEAAKDYFEHPTFSLSGCVPACEYSDLSSELIEVANKLYARLPFEVNSAYRSVAWDRSKGRSGNSSHCKGYALDIRCINHDLRRRYIAELLALGVKRIGIAKTFIHFDVDPDKAPSMWLYNPDNINKTF